jgi:hypothetical protein
MGREHEDALGRGHEDALGRGHEDAMGRGHEDVMGRVEWRESMHLDMVWRRRVPT